MNNEKLLKLLKLVDGVYHSDWNTVRKIVELIEKKEVIVIDSEWRDPFKVKWKETYPLELNKLSTWSTYDDCITLLFNTVYGTDKLTCSVKVWNGDNMFGGRTDLRFIANLEIPISFLENIEDKIQLTFDTYLIQQYKQHLCEQEKQWIKNLREMILR
jgi:hypothetical protein